MTGLIPFLVRRSEPALQAPPQRIRYDLVRQISQIEVQGIWIDSPDFRCEEFGSTRMTRVRAETTDDA